MVLHVFYLDVKILLEVIQLSALETWYTVCPVKRYCVTGVRAPHVYIVIMLFKRLLTMYYFNYLAVF